MVNSESSKCEQCSTTDAVECMLIHADNGFGHGDRCSCICHVAPLNRLYKAAQESSYAVRLEGLKVVNDILGDHEDGKGRNANASN